MTSGLGVIVTCIFFGSLLDREVPWLFWLLMEGVWKEKEKIRDEEIVWDGKESLY